MYLIFISQKVLSKIKKLNPGILGKRPDIHLTLSLIQVLWRLNCVKTEMNGGTNALES